MSLYRGYFVPGGTDPTGMDIVTGDLVPDNNGGPGNAIPGLLPPGLPVGDDGKITPVTIPPAQSPCEKTVGISFTEDRVTGIASIYTSLVSDCHVRLDRSNPDWSGALSKIRSCLGNCCIGDLVFTGHGSSGNAGPITAESLGLRNDQTKFLDSLQPLICKGKAKPVTCTLRMCEVGAGKRGRKFVCALSRKLGTEVVAWDDTYAVVPFGNEVRGGPNGGCVTPRCMKWNGTFREPLWRYFSEDLPNTYWP